MPCYQLCLQHPINQRSFDREKRLNNSPAEKIVSQLWQHWRHRGTPIQYANFILTLLDKAAHSQIDYVRQVRLLRWRLFKHNIQCGKAYYITRHLSMSLVPIWTVPTLAVDDLPNQLAFSSIGTWIAFRPAKRSDMSILCCCRSTISGL